MGFLIRLAEAAAITVISIVVAKEVESWYEEEEA